MLRWSCGTNAMRQSIRYEKNQSYCTKRLHTHAFSPFLTYGKWNSSKEAPCLNSWKHAGQRPPVTNTPPRSSEKCELPSKLLPLCVINSRLSQHFFTYPSLNHQVCPLSHWCQGNSVCNTGALLLFFFAQQQKKRISSEGNPSYLEESRSYWSFSYQKTPCFLSSTFDKGQLVQLLPFL